MVAPAVIGTVLVLLTWGVALIGLTGSGLLAASVTARGERLSTVLSSSIWWGLGFITLLVLALSVWFPLAGGLTSGVLTVTIIVLSVPGFWLLGRRWSHRRSAVSWPRGIPLLYIASLAAMLVYLAFKTLGPATNYDTGLYHLGMIRYLGEYGTVTGLANLFLPFGYTNAQFPLAAALMGTPWGAEGWRLLNGLLVVLVCADLVIRIVTRRWGWGTYTLIVGVAASSLPLVAMADALVASPTSDTAVLLLTLVAAAYLCDLVEGRAGIGSSIATIAVTTGLMVAMRPTMIAYAAGAWLVVALVLLRGRAGQTVPTGAWILSGVWLALLGVIQVARDHVLSGWLLYPLSIFPWSVPWLAPDPTALRNATLAAARDPLADDGYQVAHSWGWIGPWTLRLPQQWEPWFLLAGILGMVVALVWASRHPRPGRRASALVLVLLPSLVAIVGWFVLSPPSFRFAWGPLFTVLFIAIGWALDELTKAGVSTARPVAAAAVVVISVTCFSALFRSQAGAFDTHADFRLGPLSVPYSYAPVPEVATTDLTMIGGLVVRTPVVGDQCWATYPLCTFSMGDRIGLRGSGIADGFVTLPSQ